MASIEKRELANGKVRWKVRVFIGRDPETGKRRYLIKTFDRLADAKAKAGELEGIKQGGPLSVPTKDSLSKYLKTWLDTHQLIVKARTIYDYRSILNRYIINPPAGMPPLGFVRLDRLSPDGFDQLYIHMREEMGLSPRTIRYLHTILRRALKDAKTKRKLQWNPTDDVRPPTQAKVGDREEAGSDRGEKAVRAMTEEEAGRFLASAREDRYFALWALLLTGGLRPGEALALGWPDVNLEEGKVHVQRALTRRGVKGWRFVTPKTKKGRVVAIPAVAVQALREWRTVQARERLQLGAEYEDNGFVFATEFGKPLDSGNLLSRNFRAIMAGAQLGEWETVRVGRRVKEDKRRFRPAFRMYDLRHTCATLLLKSGVNAKIVQERLGHSSITLTLDTYSHVLPDMQEGAADAMEAMFGGGS